MKIIRPALVLFLMLSLLTGLVYPAIVTVIGQICFSNQANGSLIKVNDQIIGSKWIGQSFSNPGYFWGRPSATLPTPYNPLASSGSNLSVFNSVLIEAMNARITALRSEEQTSALVPVDLIMASASGLDPELSIAGVIFQIDRVAKARNLPIQEVRDLVEQNIQNRQWGIFGEPRINILKLNMELDSHSR